MSAEEFTPFTRSSVNCVSHSERFILKKKNFIRQYAHLYAERLLSLGPKIKETAQRRWGNDTPFRKLFELTADEKCIIIGTLYKHMELKPNILKEISEDNALMPQVFSADKYISDSDQLILEDELQRILLIGDINKDSYVTGIVIAVMGKEPEDDRGKFHVEDYCFVDLPLQDKYPDIENDQYVALLSGLDIGCKNENLINIQILTDILTGMGGDVEEQEQNSKIARLIIAGNCLSKDTQKKDQMNKAKYLTKNETVASVGAMKLFDDFLTQFTGSMEVDLMPGEYDPSNFTLPQQPLHPCMFPQSFRFPTLNLRTNPYEFSVNGVRFLGTSGQNVADIYKYVECKDRLEILKNTINWGHIAPTAPDTLGCYPYYDSDPFIMSECPHVYFVGNQPEFSKKLYRMTNGQEVLLITIPRFSQSGCCVLVNLRNLDCEAMYVGTSLDDLNDESPKGEK